MEKKNVAKILHFNFFFSVSYCSSLIRGNNGVPSGHGCSRLFLSDKRNQDLIEEYFPNNGQWVVTRTLRQPNNSAIT